MVLGLIGGMTDTLQSMVLPPLILLCEEHKGRNSVRFLGTYETSGHIAFRVTKTASALAIAVAGLMFIVVATTSTAREICPTCFSKNSNI
jgi:hypothetical protein